jgi:osmoprotectant transport system substrate-binding protein
LLRHFDPGTPATTSDEINRVLPGFVGRELRVLAPARAVVQDVYVVTRKYARENQLSSLDDLSEVSREAVLGGPPSLAERPAGVPGLEEVYGARFRRFRPYDSTAQRVRALNADTIQVAAFLSVNPAIAANGYVRLADPQSMILPQNVVPLVRADVAGNAAAAAALAAVQSALTTDELAGLLARVTGGREAPRKAADDWLRRQGLR